MKVGWRWIASSLSLWLLLLAPSTASAQTFEVIDSFDGCPSGGCAAGGDVAKPNGTLVRGPDGNFYGASGLDSRPGEATPRSYGTIFRLTPAGVRTILHQLNPANGDGCDPLGKLAIAANGTIYGVTAASTCSLAKLFRIESGVYTALHTFSDVFTGPAGGVVLVNGIVYGPLSQFVPGFPATLFWWDGAYHYVTVGGAGDPQADPLLASDGNGYLVVRAPLVLPGQSPGAVWRIRRQVPPGGSPVELVRAFLVGEGNPNGGLFQGAEGLLYGSTDSLAYRLSLTGTFTPLAQCGCGTNGGLAQGLDGALYSLATGTPDGVERLLRITPGAVQTVLAFGGANGSHPAFGLTRGPNGQLYGTTRAGGLSDLGVFFRLRVNGVDITANGSDGPVTLGSGQLQIAIAVQTPPPMLNPAEFYFAVLVPANVVYWLTPMGTFTTVPTRFYAGPVSSFGAAPFATSPDVSLFPAGAYAWIAVLDADMNGVPNGTYFDFAWTVKP